MRDKERETKMDEQKRKKMRKRAIPQQENLETAHLVAGIS